MIQIHRLEGFYWVARQGGYARAARSFPYPITQPAVHQQVKKLEAELGLTLFERVARDRVQLTPAGQHLFDFAAPFFERLPAVLRGLDSGDYGGKLIIQAESLLLRQLMPAWIKRLQRRQKAIQIDLREVGAADVTSLRRGETDILVAHLPELPDDIATMEIALLRPFLVMPREHDLARRSKVSPADLKDMPFISYHEGLLAHDLQMQALAMHGVHPHQVIATSSAESILGFVESGLGFSLVPSLDREGPRSRALVARPLTTPKVEFPVYAAWRKDTPENPILDAALECASRI